LNVPSSKHCKKDIIKVENRFLETVKTNKLALIAPHATAKVPLEEMRGAIGRSMLPDWKSLILHEKGLE
jgi:aspartate carbamoyltransferase regulatory subunit